MRESRLNYAVHFNPVPYGPSGKRAYDPWETYRRILRNSIYGYVFYNYHNPKVHVFRSDDLELLLPDHLPTAGWINSSLGREKDSLRFHIGASLCHNKHGCFGYTGPVDFYQPFADNNNGQRWANSVDDLVIDVTGIFFKPNLPNRFICTNCLHKAPELKQLQLSLFQ